MSIDPKTDVNTLFEPAKKNVEGEGVH